MFNLKLLSIALLTLLLVGCEDQVTRPAKPNRFVVTYHSAIGIAIITVQDTATGKCFIGNREGGLTETHVSVCQ